MLSPVMISRGGKITGCYGVFGPCFWGSVIQFGRLIDMFIMLYYVFLVSGDSVIHFGVHGGVSGEFFNIKFCGVRGFLGLVCRFNEKYYIVDSVLGIWLWV